MSDILKISVGNYAAPITDDGARIPFNWYVLGPFDYCNVEKLSITTNNESILSTLALSEQIVAPTVSAQTNSRDFVVFSDEKYASPNAILLATAKAEALQCWFQLVVFLHRAPANEQNTVHSEIHKLLQNEKMDDFEYAICHSLDCGDAVVLLLGNSAETLLSIAYRLTLDEKTYHAYSIFRHEIYLLSLLLFFHILFFLNNRIVKLHFVFCHIFLNKQYKNQRFFFR